MSNKAMASPEDGHSRGSPETRVMWILTLIVALVGVAGFAGWLAHGDTLFWSLLQAGLAWCM